MKIARIKRIKREAENIEQMKNSQRIVAKDKQQGTLILGERETPPENTAKIDRGLAMAGIPLQ